MKIKLGDSGHQDPFKFKLGDKVRVRYEERTGVVVYGEYFTDVRPYPIFYRVKLSDEVLLVMPEDIDLA